MAATRQPGQPPASASGPPSSLASSSTFDKRAEGPGRLRRASPPPRARPAAPPGDSSPSDGRCAGGRAAAPSVRGWPRLPRAGIVLAAGYAVQTPPRATRPSPATVAPGMWSGADGSPRGSLIAEAGATRNRRQGCPSRRLPKPPMPKKTPTSKAPGSAVSPLGPERPFTPPKLLPKRPQHRCPPAPGPFPLRQARRPFPRGSSNTTAYPSRVMHLPLLFLPANVVSRLAENPTPS